MTKFLKLASVYLIALAIIQPINLFAQKEGFYKELKERADFVFEGEIVKSTGKWNATKNLIYTEHEIQLSKVFKGDLRNPAVRLVTLGGETEGQFAIVGKSLQLLEGYKGVFFAQGQPFGILQGTDFGGTACFANDPAAFVPKRFNDGENAQLGYGASYQKVKYDKILAELGKVQAVFPAGPGETLFPESGCDDPSYATSAEITFQNVTISGNLEGLGADIMIKASPQGVHFGKCEFFLTYPTDVFGQNAIQNGTLTVTKGDVAQNSAYTLTKTDIATDKIRVTVELGGVLVSAYSLTGNVEKLLHFQFTVANPLGLAGLTAEDFKLEGNVWYECGRAFYPFRNVKITTEGDIILPNFEDLVGINYNIQKFYYRTQSGIQLLRFDVYASSTEPKVYNSGKLYFDYGSAAFGSNAVANNTVTTLAAGVLSPLGGTSSYTVTKFDDAANRLRVEIKKLSADPATLDQTPRLILRVTFRVNACNQNADIYWNNLTNNSDNNYLDGTDVFQYAPILFTGELTSPMCGCNQPDPVIASFADAQNNAVTQTRAGTGEVLKIKGSNFGNVIVDGSSFIEVDNADHNPDDRTIIPLGDIIDWKTNEITFVVPSTTIGKIQAPMESGEVKVFTECGGSNGEDMDVEYAVTNYRDDINLPALRAALDKQGAGGIEFTHSNNVGSFERGLTEHAINTWRCDPSAHTEIHWSLAANSVASTSVDPNDGINLIVEVNPNSGLLGANGEAAVLRFGLLGVSYFGDCQSSNGKAYYIKNIDVVINQNTNFSNMELAVARRIFLHEFGHAHMLEHASRLGTSGAQKLMYYTGANNNAITSPDKNGALTVFGASAAVLTGCSGVSPIDILGCPTPTNEVAYQDAISVSPVPFNSELNLQSETEFPLHTKVLISTLTGAQVYGSEIGQGKQFMIKGLGHLPPGMYVLSVESEGWKWSTKIVKTQGHD